MRLRLAPAIYFAIRVVDDQTGRGVPLVELRTVDSTRYYTDSAGVVAFYRVGTDGACASFLRRQPRLRLPADGFGFRGVALDVTAGGQAEIKIARKNIAERLYRVTGAGIYRDTVLVGREPPLKAIRSSMHKSPDR